MARTPKRVGIRLYELFQLLSFRWASVHSHIGELGDQTFEHLVADINLNSRIEIKPTQLADLVHHMKEVVFERVQPLKLDRTIRNHNIIMKGLKGTMPELFKELPTGEVVMVDYEDREDV